MLKPSAGNWEKWQACRFYTDDRSSTAAQDDPARVPNLDRRQKTHRRLQGGQNASMESLIRKFASAARAAGLRISTAEVLDCLDQLPKVDLLDERQFVTVLRANFAKSRLEQARFDHLYHLFFHELRRELDAASTEMAEQVERFRQSLSSEGPNAAALEAVGRFLSAQPESYLQLVQAISTDTTAEAAGKETARRGFAANAGGLVRRLQLMQAIVTARQALADYLSANLYQIHWETRSELKQLVAQRLDTAQRLLSDDGSPRSAQKQGKAVVPNRYGELGTKPFGNLSPKELIRLRDTITRLVRKLRDTVARRHRARGRGAVDMKRTLRAAARTQGIPIALKFRRKPLRKTRIVVLCDLSGSVWSSARFMLTMLYAMQECFDRVKSFVFIDAPVEVTRLFETIDIDRALEEILRSPEIAFGAATDYGRMLRLFRQLHMDTITKKTTVIVIGDGRSNYGNPEAGVLEQIRERCRRLIWLNPESEIFWYSGDSEMRAYEPFCNEVRHCQNLDQLAAFVRDLVL